MVKTVVSTIVVAVILFFGVLMEGVYIKNEFVELNSNFCVLYNKVEEKSANKEDVLAVQQNWLKKKKSLHAFIPHTEIKEVDLWLSEAVTLVEKEMWEDALSKIEVLIELSEQIPKTFKVTLENIF
jgi:hypothetical protein